MAWPCYNIVVVVGGGGGVLGRFISPPPPKKKNPGSLPILLERMGSLKVRNIVEYK